MSTNFKEGNKCYYIKIAVAVLTIAIAIFDLFSDWNALVVFVRYGQGGIVIAFGIFCGIASLLFLLEIRNFIVSIKVYRRERGVASPSASPAEHSLDRWQETVGFLLMVLEDLPNTVILYTAFRWGNCGLFNRLFQESFTANLALLGSFLSALWKLLLSFRYCCCSCCNFHDLRGTGAQCCCCCARIIRPLFALILIGYAMFLYITFNNQGSTYRQDCLVGNWTDVTTALPP